VELPWIALGKSGAHFARQVVGCSRAVSQSASARSCLRGSTGTTENTVSTNDRREELIPEANTKEKECGHPL
jgi:hypothetical protein